MDSYFRENRTLSVNHSLSNLTAYKNGTIGDLLLILFYVILMFISILGNTSLIIIICKKKRFRNSSTFIIIRSMSVADLLLTVCLCTLRLYGELITSSEAWCKLFSYWLYSCAGVSIYNLTWFSVFRYLALVHPLFTRCNVTPRKTFVVTVVLWSVCFLTNISTVLTYGITHYQVHNTTYAACHIKELKHVKISTAAFYVPNMMIPLVIIAVFHLTKFYKLQKPNISTASSQRFKVEKVSGVVVFVIIFTYAIVWVPTSVLRLVRTFTDIEIPAPFEYITKGLIFANSCLNPFLYFFISGKLCREFWCLGKSNSSSRTLD